MKFDTSYLGVGQSPVRVLGQLGGRLDVTLPQEFQSQAGTDDGTATMLREARVYDNIWACGFPKPNSVFGEVSRRALLSKTVENVKTELRAKLFQDREDRYATAVRIAFHDCVGGCDGCINRANPDNAGFMFESLDVMDTIYENYKLQMSRADFYILTAVTALEDSLKFNNDNLTQHFISPVRFDFKYGRCDCSTSPGTPVTRAFPAGHSDYQQVMDFFREEFGFSVRESVAILGAHTLGGASGAKGSGFEGFWKEDGVAADRLNNRYYSLLADDALTWENTDRSVVTGYGEERWQWETGSTSDDVPAPFMLNADIALIRNIQPNSNGKSSCQFRDCSLSPSARIVQEFASDGDTWMREFAKVFERMVAKGANQLIYPA
eukprot:GFUD01018077.1.p1 GENE.GFUD01018077.1~~GFUD01018077.1.p1  ORF type:complete len:401 (+),score=95.79 GFUD01018077.1:69-1205(+)